MAYLLGPRLNKMEFLDVTPECGIFSLDKPFLKKCITKSIYFLKCAVDYFI